MDFYGNRTAIPATSYSADYGFDHGLAAGAGVEFGGGHLRIAPEIRYIRWKNPAFSEYGSRGYYILGPQDEVQMLGVKCDIEVTRSGSQSEPRP